MFSEWNFKKKFNQKKVLFYAHKNNMQKDGRIIALKKGHLRKAKL